MSFIFKLCLYLAVRTGLFNVQIEQYSAEIKAIDMPIDKCSAALSGMMRMVFGLPPALLQVYTE